MSGGTTYGSDLTALDRYFLPYAVAARAGRWGEWRQCFCSWCHRGRQARKTPSRETRNLW